MVVGEVEDAAYVVLLAPNVFLHLGVHRARVSASRGGGVRHPSHLLEGGVAAEEVGLVALRGVARQRPHHGAIGLEVVADQIPSGFVARASAASAAAPAASAPSASAAVLLIVLLVPTTAAAAPPSAASPAAPASPSSALIIQGGIRVPPATASAAAAVVVVVLVPASSASSTASSPATATPPTGTHRGCTRGGADGCGAHLFSGERCAR